ncbi:hypothetical protein LTR97_006033 [Elasticomyces elasticus]|uniref:Uncharacterized protein n=1 Tax=Elasticomyces elasticus TaxID=574655 RepID=A0AAN7W7B9_9PEZI|nr:hypothetical protein LTR97_006033 [Elasticomyces elasticus]
MDVPSQPSEGQTFVLPLAEATRIARSKLLPNLPEKGLGAEQIQNHLREDIVPGLNRASQSPNYYGFVIGGVTPAAAFADNVVTEVDQNVHVHLPNETISTDVEDRALSMVCEMIGLPPAEWPHRIFTTGATASNVVGLACGREFVLREAAKVSSSGKYASVAEHGLFEAMKLAGKSRVQILTTVPHSSLRKAASIVGLGRASVVDVGMPDQRQIFDLPLLEKRLKEDTTIASILAVSCAEVNTGLFATNGQDMQHIRKLCDQYGAWLHVDAAFGLLARVLPENDEYSTLKAGVAGLELADSITGDAHKLINVPYDCGIYLSRHLDVGIEVFHNPNAAYLNTASTESTTSTDRMIPSPLNIGIENSRRFRALPVYATLAAYGREGYREMLERQIALARAIAQYLLDGKDYVLLPQHSKGNSSDPLQHIYIVVLFRAKDEQLNKTLVKRVNASRRLYVSGTEWDGSPAVRFAISNWEVDVERDLRIVKDVLVEAAS